MRNIFNAIIIVFVVVSLYIIKDDVFVVYNKSASFIKDEFNLVKDFSENFFSKDEVAVIDQEEEIYEKINSDTLPEPLIVSNTLLSDSQDVNLDSSKVIEETNKRREENNLPELKINEKLNLSAEKKLKDMFKNNYFEHVSPNGVSISDLGDSAGYEYIIIGENLAMGNFKNEEALLDAWINSPGHRANILNSKYTEIGVSVEMGEYNGKQTWIAVQHFGTSKSFCPSINVKLHDLIEINQEQITQIENELNDKKNNIDAGIIYMGKSRNEQITEYNDLVNTYNEMILNLKSDINEYNNGVNSFNECISNFSSNIEEDTQ